MGVTTLIDSRSLSTLSTPLSRQVGDENGSSFAIDFDLRWCAGVVVSGFTKNPRSISAFWVSERSYLMV
jgi:hypothetical protein